MENDERSLNAINLLFDFSFGTLWWLNDKLWKEQKTDFVLRKDRKQHPGLSLGKSQFKSLNQTVPMFLGSHSISSGFPVNNLTENESSKKSKKVGRFYVIRPYNFAVKYVLGKNPGIVRNSIKPKLSNDEINDLKHYLAQRGLSYE